MKEMRGSCIIRFQMINFSTNYPCRISNQLARISITNKQTIKIKNSWIIISWSATNRWITRKYSMHFYQIKIQAIYQDNWKLIWAMRLLSKKNLRKKIKGSIHKILRVYPIIQERNSPIFLAQKQTRISKLSFHLQPKIEYLMNPRRWRWHKFKNLL